MEALLQEVILVVKRILLLYQVSYMFLVESLVMLLHKVFLNLNKNYLLKGDLT